MPAGTVLSGTPQRGDVVERGLLIGRKSVPGSCCPDGGGVSAVGRRMLLLAAGAGRWGCG
jgi:hypothetical protein